MTGHIESAPLCVADAELADADLRPSGLGPVPGFDQSTDDAL